MPVHFLRCSSDDRVAGTINEFEVDLSALPKLQQCRSVKVRYVGFPYVDTNVNERNNTLVLQTVIPPSFAAPIPPGSVIPFQFRENGLDPLGEPYTLNLNPALTEIAEQVVALQAQLDAGVNQDFPSTNSLVQLVWNAVANQLSWFVSGTESPTIAFPPVGLLPDEISPQVGELFGFPEEGIIAPLVRTTLAVTRVKDNIFEIPPAQYEIEPFLTALQDAINTQEPTWGFSATLIDETTNPRVVLASGGILLRYLSRLDEPRSTMSNLLGIVESSPGYVASFTSQSTPNLIGLSAAFLHSKTCALARGKQARNGLTGENALSLAIVTAIPLYHVEYGQYVNYEPITENMIEFTSPVNLTRIAFRLRSQYDGGRLVDLTPPGLSVMLEIDVV